MFETVSRLNAGLEGPCSMERELGEGGMATFYLAEDVLHHRKVALKDDDESWACDRSRAHRRSSSPSRTGRRDRLFDKSLPD